MTEDQSFDYLYERAIRHDMTVGDLLSRTPDSVSDCYIESAEFWREYDISHIHAQSTHPELADVPTNVVPEDPSLNRSRGAESMTDAEVADAWNQAEARAEVIDATYTHDGTGGTDMYDIWFAWA